MTPGDRPRKPLTRFAGEVVGLKEGLNPDERLAALFRKLRDDDFLPDPLTHEALLALAGRPIESGSLLGEEAVASEERKLHAEVEQFASEFFEIPINARVDRWRTLAQACARYPRLIDRLRTLKPGLGIDRGAVNDPSPVVKRLLDDLLTLFPLRTETRAVESRARLEQFRSDPSLTPAHRAKALKQVLKRHPTIAALSHGYLVQLGQSQRSIKPARTKARTASSWNLRFEENRTAYILLFVSVLGSVGRLANSSRTTNPPQPVPATISLAPNFQSPINPNSTRIPRSKLPPSLRPMILRDEIKSKVKSEVIRVGKTIDEDQLLKIVNELPFDRMPSAEGVVPVVLEGNWTEERRARFIDRLKQGLKSTDLEWSEQELDDLAKNCFPEPTKRPAPSQTQSP